MPNVIKQIVKAGEYGTQTIKMIVKANERGPQGKQGEQGVQGPQGIPGPRGFDGAIQYRAGTGIKITDDNIIEATGESTSAWGGIQGNIQDQTDLQNEFGQYTKTVNLATVATTGDYDDLTDKPTIPTVNDATLTIQSDGTTVGTFTANSSTNVTANVIPPVRVGSVISQPTDVAFVDTVNIVNGAVTGSKVNFTTMKKWVPDYGNKTNLGSSTTSYTATATGWISFNIECYNRSGGADPQINLKMNNNDFIVVKGASTNASGDIIIDYSTIFEVAEGDTFSYSETNVAEHNLRELYFIPGKWVN